MAIESRDDWQDRVRSYIGERCPVRFELKKAGEWLVIFVGEGDKTFHFGFKLPPSGIPEHHPADVAQKLLDVRDGLELGLKLAGVRAA